MSTQTPSRTLQPKKGRNRGGWVIRVALIAMFLTGCSVTTNEPSEPPELNTRFDSNSYSLDGWTLELHKSRSTVAHALRETYNNTPAAVISSLFTVGFVDYQSKTAHAQAPTSTSDAYNMCVIGHEIYHVVEGLYHESHDSTCMDAYVDKDTRTNNNRISKNTN